MRNPKLIATSAFLAALALPTVARAQVFEDQGAAALPQGCNGSGCWTNYARATDYDGDGDLDLVGVNNGGFFANPSAQALIFWKNSGAGQFTDDSAAHGNTVAPLRQVAFGDVDGDGDLDFYAPSAGGSSGGPDRLFINNNGTFTNEAAARLPANLASNAGAARMGDVDNDGDLDILVANGYFGSGPSLGIYINGGSGNFTAATAPALSGGNNPDDIDLVDVDGDFDLDVLVNFHQGQNALFKNSGTGTFTSASAGLPSLDGGAFHYGPAFCDVDGDGDRDYFVDNAGDGYEEVLAINDGSGNFTDESAERITGNSGEDDNLVVCLDYDGDGDLDFIVGALSSPQRLFQNDGTGNFSFVSGAFGGGAVPTLWIDAGDLNGDGRLDVFVATGEGNPQTERFWLGSAQVAVDTVGPKIIGTETATLSSTAATTVRFAVSDNAVTDEGPRLSRAYVLVGTTEVEATFMGGDLYRAVVPATPETEYVACAVDLEGNISPGCPGGTGEGGGGPGGGGPGGGSANGGNGAGGSPSSGGSGSGGEGADSGSEDGCSCEVPAGNTGNTAGFALAGLALAIATRRRRSST